MPWFHHRSDDEKQREQEQKAEQERSQQALATGGIPLQAQRRLDELKGRGGKFFTSDLSVNEFLLARQVGLRPITQVMGSSIYHVGWQFTPGTWYAQSQELGVVSQAMNDCRTLALGRLSEEAERVGADAVLGVRVTRGRYEWGENLLEFNAIGTAVRLEGSQRQGPPALITLSGQDFWKLYQAGYWPAGVVGGSTAFYVVASWQTQRVTSGFSWGSWFNQELPDFTRGVYAARHLAMRHVQNQAHDLKAAGVVGVEIEQEEEEHEVDMGNDQERTDMIFTFHTLGTAIVSSDQNAGQLCQPVLNLK